MNYKKIYDKLINSRQVLNRNRKDNVYYENHHILPKSIGGLNNKDNLVLLTFREHFLAHLLLVHIYTYDPLLKRKMVYALYELTRRSKTHQRILSSRQYETARTLFVQAVSETHKGKKMSDEAKEKIGKKSKERWENKEFRQNRSDASKGEKNSFYGKTHTEETKNKIRKHKMPSESREKLSKANSGRKHTKEEKEKISNANKNRTIEQKEAISKKISESVSGERHPMYGKHHSEASKQKMREKKLGEKNHNFGKKKSENTLQKMSEAKLGEKNPMFGKKLSEEHKAKISKSGKGRIISEEHRAKLRASNLGKKHIKRNFSN